MKRMTQTPRHNWQRTVEEQGLIYHTPNGQTYWDESACYQFSAQEIDTLEAATNTLQEMCLAAGQFIIDNDRFSDLCIPSVAIPFIKEAWESEPPSIYGRFDLAYDGDGPPKLLEYNADTPTALIEASVIQWYWRESVYPDADQFNSIHDKLIAKWKDLKTYLKGDVLYFCHSDDLEDWMTVSYLRDTAQQSDIITSGLLTKELGWNAHAKTFRDTQERVIQSIFALYPWEWLLGEFSEPILAAQKDMVWMEPVWKMLWSNKGLLAILWEMYPHHDYLLEAHLRQYNASWHQSDAAEYVRKPLLSREGANVTIHSAAGTLETSGDYGEEGYVYQALAPIPNFDGNFPVIGSWLITDQGAAGIGIRESSTLITDNLSHFVPHYFQ